MKYIIPWVLLVLAACNRDAPVEPAGPSGATAAATAAPASGLDFPSNGQAVGDIRFRFTGANLPPMYPSTYVWKYFPRRQAGYYCPFYWGADGAFTGNAYYMAQPYPDGDSKSTSTSHKWSLGVYGYNFVRDEGGRSTQLGYDAWHWQAFRAYVSGSSKIHEFYWDLPDTTKVIRYATPQSYGSSPPANPALSFGDAPWSIGRQRLSGILRGLQLYSARLGMAEVLAETGAPLSTQAGAAGIWYLNVNPVPDDISDKSGRGHHPAWAGSGRPAAWTDTAGNGEPPPVPAPQVGLSANPASVAAGGTSTLSWSSSNASSCAASGAWSGTKSLSGSEATAALSSTSTFTLTCTGPGGSASASATVTVNQTPPPPGGTTGLDFPSNGAVANDVRFRFRGSSLIPMYPATYIWRVNPRQQAGYYTTFFWGPDGAFTGADYYGCHPYPDGGGHTPTTHKWELSINGYDFVTDVYGHSTQVAYGAWKTQAMRAYDNGTNKVHEFYWDLPDTTKVIRYKTARSYGSSPPSNAALTFGTAPWAPSTEHLSGILRGIQLYAAALSNADMLGEAGAPLSTAAGGAGIWYLNMNPTPSDIADKSGKGHHPEWVTTLRPALWTGP